MAEVVLDASALLAVLNSEPGGELVEEALAEAVISAVNLSEVVAKLADAGMPGDAIRRTLEGLPFEVAAFDVAQAYEAGLLQTLTRRAGVSLGDRSCLSLARILGLAVLTTDRRWVTLGVGVEVRVIR